MKNAELPEGHNFHNHNANGLRYKSEIQTQQTNHNPQS